MFNPISGKPFRSVEIILEKNDELRIKNISKLIEDMGFGIVGFNSIENEPKKCSAFLIIGEEDAVSLKDLIYSEYNIDAIISPTFKLENNGKTCLVMFYMVKATTGCSCCREQNHYMGKIFFYEKDAIEICEKLHHNKHLVSQSAANGVYYVYDGWFELDEDTDKNHFTLIDYYDEGISLKIKCDIDEEKHWKSRDIPATLIEYWLEKISLKYCYNKQFNKN